MEELVCAVTRVTVAIVVAIACPVTSPFPIIVSAKKYQHISGSNVLLYLNSIPESGVTSSVLGDRKKMPLVAEQ